MGNRALATARFQARTTHLLYLCNALGIFKMHQNSAASDTVSGADKLMAPTTVLPILQTPAEYVQSCNPSHAIVICNLNMSNLATHLMLLVKKHRPPIPATYPAANKPYKITRLPNGPIKVGRRWGQLHQTRSHSRQALRHALTPCLSKALRVSHWLPPALP